MALALNVVRPEPLTVCRSSEGADSIAVVIGASLGLATIGLVAEACSEACTESCDTKVSAVSDALPDAVSDALPDAMSDALPNTLPDCKAPLEVAVGSLVAA